MQLINYQNTLVRYAILYRFVNVIFRNHDGTQRNFSFFKNRVIQFRSCVLLKCTRHSNCEMTFCPQTETTNVCVGSSDNKTHFKRRFIDKYLSQNDFNNSAFAYNRMDSVFKQKKKNN